MPTILGNALCPNSGVNVPATASYNPLTAFAGQIAYWDPDAGVAQTGGNISTWTSQGIPIVVAAANGVPTLVNTGGKNFVQQAGTTNLTVNVTGQFVASDLTFVVAGNVGGPTGNCPIYSVGTDGSQDIGWVSYDATPDISLVGFDYFFTGTGSAWASAQQVRAQVFAAAGGLYQGGTTLEAATLGPTALTLKTLVVGGYPGGLGDLGNHSKIRAAMIIFRKVTQPEYVTLFNYLTAKL